MVNKKVLIVDDDEDLIEVMKITLEREMYNVISATSGDEGIKMAQKEKPDIIILDVMMETSNKGFDVARNIRSEKGTSKIPILMLTALKERTGFDFSNEAGDKTWLPVDAFIEKPIHHNNLIAKVKELLRK